MNSSLVLLLSVLSFGSLAYAQVPFPNECPEVKVVDTFDLDKYMGIWYEYSKYPAIFEIGKKCMYAIYKNNGNDTVDVMNASINRMNGQPSSIKGTAYVKGPGKLAVVFTSRQRSDKPNYLILGTDYSSYAVVYHCSSLTPLANTKFLWILTRERLPTEETIKTAKKIIDDNNLSQAFLMDTIQTNCPDIDANGNGVNKNNNGNDRSDRNDGKDGNDKNDKNDENDSMSESDLFPTTTMNVMSEA